MSQCPVISSLRQFYMCMDLLTSEAWAQGRAKVPKISGRYWGRDQALLGKMALEGGVV